MAFTWGKNLKITIFGESHGKCVGAVIDGLGAGIDINHEKIKNKLEKRRPSTSAGSTKRREDDEYDIISGIFNNKTNGGPITVLFSNKDSRSRDYEKVRNIPRPSHADYPAYIKYGNHNDFRGGGFFSARMTAPIVFASALLSSILESDGIIVKSHLLQVGSICDKSYLEYSYENLENIVINQNSIYLNKIFEENVSHLIKEVNERGDSVGARVEGIVIGLKPGIGEPYFDSIESKVSSLMFSIPGIKAIEFGIGVDFANSFGSVVNDEYMIVDDKISTYTNNNGGILGGLSTGMPIVCKATFKPTPSIMKEQRTVDLSQKTDKTINIEGRHDSCIGIRGAVLVESVLTLALYDLLY